MGVVLVERLEFGNEDQICRLVRAAEEEAARREAGLRRWRVGYTVMAAGEVLVDAPSEAEARRMVEEGEVDVDPGGWEDLVVETVESVDPEPQAPSGPEQVVFPF